MSRCLMSALLVASTITLALPEVATAQEDTPGSVLPATRDVAVFCATYTDISVPPVNQFQKASNVDKSCDDDHLGLLYVNGKSYSHLRECAFAQGDALTLATLYADGLGVKKNLDVARKFACEITAGDGLNRPAALTPGSLGKKAPFETCEDAGAALDMHDCARVATGIASVDLIHRLKGLSARWPVAKSRQFEELAYLKNLYIKVKGEAGETEFRNGEMGELSRTYDISEVDTEFVTLLEALEREKLSKVSPTEVSATSLQLEKEISNLSNKDALFVARPGMQAVQKSYVRYREGWVDFARTYYPTPSATEVRFALDRSRLESLEAVSSDSDAPEEPAPDEPQTSGPTRPTLNQAPPIAAQ